MNTLFDNGLDEQIKAICAQIEALPLEEKIEALNRIRSSLHEISPFRNEPVDLVLWVKSEDVIPNNYNPNVVYRPEMRLLEYSVKTYGVAYAIAAHRNSSEYIVVDGEHRHTILSTNKPLIKRLHGYTPVAPLGTKTDEDRMAATIAFNRARGVHKLDSMSDIVISMIRAGWTDDEVADALGMDADEILRMKQVSGIAKIFERENYNRAWVNDNEADALD